MGARIPRGFGPKFCVNNCLRPCMLKNFCDFVHCFPRVSIQLPPDARSLKYYITDWDTSQIVGWPAYPTVKASMNLKLLLLFVLLLNHTVRHFNVDESSWKRKVWATFIMDHKTDWTYIGMDDRTKKRTGKSPAKELSYRAAVLCENPLTSHWECCKHVEKFSYNTAPR